MKKIIKFSIAILIGIISTGAKAQSPYVHLTYGYDDNGNRISRTMTTVLKKKADNKVGKESLESKDPQVNNQAARASIGHLQVSPNPASDWVKIVIGDFSKTVNPAMELTDHRGRLVLKKQLESETELINLEALAPGIYELKVHLGYQVEIYKLVKI